VGRVLVTRQLPEGGLDQLAAEGHAVFGRTDDVPYSHEELVDAVTEADAVICLLTDRIDEAVLRAGAGGSLKVVGNVAVGYDNVDVAAARQLHVAVCNTPGVLDETTADLAFLLILAASRLSSAAEHDLRAGAWPGWGINQYLGRDVHGATLGLVGYGRIAQAVARRAGGFGMQVLHHTRNPTGTPGFVARLDDLLERCDIVSMHVPLNEQSRHLLGARELALLPAHAVVVNTARGPVIDEEALAEALHAGTIFAAGLDVYEREPAVHPSLLSAPRTVLLPHIGSASRATRTQMARVATSGVCDVLAGRRPPNLVTT
jgi:glyoxylate reductase